MGSFCTKISSFFKIPDENIAHANPYGKLESPINKRASKELPVIVRKDKPAAHQWVRFKDDISQEIFWHNAATGETLSDANFPPKKPTSIKDYKPPPPPPVDSPELQPKPCPPPSPTPDDDDDDDDQLGDQSNHIQDSAVQAAFIHLKLRLSNEIATNLALGSEKGQKARAWLDSITATQYCDPESAERAKIYIQDLKRCNAALQHSLPTSTSTTEQRRIRRKKTAFGPTAEIDDEGT